MTTQPANNRAVITERGVPWAIATSGRRATAHTAPAMLGLPDHTPMTTRDLVHFAEPDLPPDPLMWAAARTAHPSRHHGKNVMWIAGTVTASSTA